MGAGEQSFGRRGWQTTPLCVAGGIPPLRLGQKSFENKPLRAAPLVATAKRWQWQCHLGGLDAAACCLEEADQTPQKAPRQKPEAEAKELFTFAGASDLERRVRLLNGSTEIVAPEQAWGRHGWHSPVNRGQG
jgi:hypothetical protein